MQKLIFVRSKDSRKLLSLMQIGLVLLSQVIWAPLAMATQSGREEFLALKELIGRGRDRDVSRLLAFHDGEVAEITRALNRKARGTNEMGIVNDRDMMRRFFETIQDPKEQRALMLGFFSLSKDEMRQVHPDVIQSIVQRTPPEFLLKMANEKLKPPALLLTLPGSVLQHLDEAQRNEIRNIPEDKIREVALSLELVREPREGSSRETLPFSSEVYGIMTSKQREEVNSVVRARGGLILSQWEEAARDADTRRSAQKFPSSSGGGSPGSSTTLDSTSGPVGRLVPRESTRFAPLPEGDSSLEKYAKVHPQRSSSSKRSVMLPGVLGLVTNAKEMLRNLYYRRTSSGSAKKE